MRTEACYVSDIIDGPYTGKDVLCSDLAGWNSGTAQGGIVQAPNGKWYSIVFQDHGALGRIPVLVPVQFIDDFPVFGAAGFAPKEVNVQTSSAEDRFAETMAKIIDMKNELHEEINDYLNIKFQTIQIINKIDNDEYVNILMRRYLYYEEWADIADALGYTRQTIDNKHGKALLEFEKLFTQFDMILH
jgi:beta-xylosidase